MDPQKYPGHLKDEQKHGRHDSRSEIERRMGKTDYSPCPIKEINLLIGQELSVAYIDPSYISEHKTLDNIFGTPERPNTLYNIPGAKTQDNPVNGYMVLDSMPTMNSKIRDNDVINVADDLEQAVLDKGIHPKGYAGRYIMLGLVRQDVFSEYNETDIDEN